MTRRDIEKIDNYIQGVTSNVLGNDFEPLSPELTINSTFEQVAKYYDEFRQFESEYQYRKHNSPNFIVALRSWIDEISYYVREGIEDDSETSSNICGISYWRTTKGKYSLVSHIVNNAILSEPGGDQLNEFMIELFLKEIAKGYVYAFKLPELETELRYLLDPLPPVNPIDVIKPDAIEFGENKIHNEIKEVDNNLPESVTAKKLKWLGTPSQFGFIVDLLIQGGYLKKPTSSFEKDAAYYLKIFDIDTTITTLPKELSETTNSIVAVNRNKIKIPPKDEIK